jgi:hypothetical protein
MTAAGAVLAIIVGTPTPCAAFTMQPVQLTVAYAGPESESVGAHTIVILQSEEPRRNPWSEIVTLGLLPHSGSGETSTHPSIVQYSGVSRYISRRDDGASYAIFTFSPHPTGVQFYIVASEADPDLPPGCKPIVWSFVLGQFSEP